MALSAKAQKALEQAKIALSMLYAIDYFTEEEWISLDGLIHKGNYVFTNGPSNADGSDDLQASVNSLPPNNNPQHTRLTSENASAAGTQDTSRFMDEDIPRQSTPAASLVDHQPSQHAGALPLGYTKEQLEESRAFRAQVSRSGNLDHFSSDGPSSTWNEDTRIPHYSASPIERVSRVSSWATRADPTEGGPTNPNSSAWSRNVLNDNFSQLHGLETTNASGFSSERTGTPGGNWISSDASAASSSSYLPPGQRGDTIYISPGKILVAQRSHSNEKANSSSLEFVIGDPIQIVSFVSGVIWYARNSRTKYKGQISHTVFATSKNTSFVVSRHAEGMVAEATFPPRASPAISNGKTWNPPSRSLSISTPQIARASPSSMASPSSIATPSTWLGAVPAHARPEPSPAFKLQPTVEPEQVAELNIFEEPVASPQPTNTGQSFDGTRWGLTPEPCWDFETGNAAEWDEAPELVAPLPSSTASEYNTNPGSQTADAAAENNENEDLLEDVEVSEHATPITDFKVDDVQPPIENDGTSFPASAVASESASPSLAENANSEPPVERFMTDLPGDHAEAPSADPAVLDSGVDPIEEDDANSGAWTSVPIRHNNGPAVADPQHARSPVASVPMLAASRYALLDDGDELEAMVGGKNLDPEMVKEFHKIMDLKMEEIRRTAMGASSSIPPYRSSRNKYVSKTPLQEPLPPLVNKKYICWFWQTGKGCRFTAEECVNLHENAPGAVLNLRMGKPNWGASADYPLPSEENTQHSTNPNYKTLTCYYWATKGQCHHSAADCKYLHEHIPGGVAGPPKVWKTRPSTGADPWLNSETASSAAGSDWKHKEEVVEDNTLRDSWGGNIYKPPHIQAMEARASQQATGW